MYAVIDTNVLVVTNGDSPQASTQCVLACEQRLQTIQQSEVLVLDDSWHILKEYKKNVREKPQQVGYEFLLWLLTNRKNPTRCTYVSITPEDNTFREFPRDPELEKFDPSDRKFIAVALTHPECPTVYNAVDRRWYPFRDALKAAGVQVEFLCPDQFTS